jgi:2'-5' RNA ligase
MALLAETYVVLDVPEPFAGRVLALRRQARDDFRAALPVEITLIGSGGAGPITRDQGSRSVTEAVRAVIGATTAIETSFGAPHRFPGSDVFAFPLVPAEPIVDLHVRLRAAGLVCRPSAWPFVPHCTIRSRAPIRDDEAEAVLRERIEGAVALATASIYTTDGLPRLVLVERVRLAAS